MNAIEQMLTGQTGMSDFIPMLWEDEKLQNQVRMLVPQEARNNGEHIFWRKISYSSLKKYEFDFWKFLLGMCRFDGSIGDALNIFGALKIAYSYYYPEKAYTKKYEEAYDVYLDAVKDCFDGPEVRHIVEQIVNDALLLNAKSKRIKYAKDRIEIYFHVENKKRPRWIQGPEWPMGINSPMQFISQRRNGESVKYTFIDIDSGAQKIVEQMY